MDESKPSIPSHEPSPQPASDWKPAVVDSFSADLAKSDKLVAPERQRRSGQSELCQNDPPKGSSVVYCGNEEEVSRGFLIALRAMGVAAVEQPPEPARPPVARAKP
jgi:hypothetical protein